MMQRYAAARASVTVDSVCVMHPASAASMDRTASATITLVFASEESSAEVIRLRSHWFQK